MKERPILFSGPMVRAILDGRKTQTRRVVKSCDGITNMGVPYKHISHQVVDLDARKIKTITHTPEGNPYVATIECPYGKVGDRLWVRETWATTTNVERDADWPMRPHVAPEWDDAADPERTMMAATIFAADGYWRWTDGDGGQLERADGSEGSCWKPSIFMPRWASRITLEITGVRVERLQDISRPDIDAEGVLSTEEWTQYIDDMSSFQQDDIHLMTPQEYMATRWDRINGKKHPWASNPWVWVVEFKKI